MYKSSQFNSVHRGETDLYWFQDLAQYAPGETFNYYRSQQREGRNPHRDWGIRAGSLALRTLCAICYAHFGSPIEKEKERERE